MSLQYVTLVLTQDRQVSGCFPELGIRPWTPSVTCWKSNVSAAEDSQGRAVTFLRCGGKYNNALLQIYCKIQQWKNFENPSTIPKIKPKTRVVCFLTHSVLLQYSIVTIRTLRERKPLPMPQFQPKVIQNFNPDFWINIIWIQMSVGSVPKCCGCIIHFAKYGTNRPLIVWEMLNNVQKSPITQWWKNDKSDAESTHRSESPPKVNHF